MGSQSYTVVTLTGRATGVIVGDRFVTALIAQTGAAGNSIGVARTNAAIGELLPINNLGTSQVEAGAAIAAGALVESDALGRAVTKAAGVTLGRLAPGESAAALGALVEIILIPN